MEAYGALIALYTFATPVNVCPSVTPISVIFEKQNLGGWALSLGNRSITYFTKETLGMFPDEMNEI